MLWQNIVTFPFVPLGLGLLTALQSFFQPPRICLCPSAGCYSACALIDSM